MLYMTTLNSHDTYTAHRALSEDTAPDGGLYIPFSLPTIDAQQLQDFVSRGCCETVAQILNLFFSARLNAWDVQVCIGRNPVKISNPGRKIWIAETWANPGGSYEYVVSSLNDRLLGGSNVPVRSWTRIAIGIALAFGIYAEIHHSEEWEHSTTYDICVPDGDLSQPLCMLYARKMGLPVGKIIICSRANGAIWNLVNYGQLNTAQVSASNRLAIQRLFSCVLGQQSVADYNSACDRNGIYSALPEQQSVIADSLFAAVIGDARIDAVLENIGISIAPDTAVCYAGLQDYRAKTGQGRQTVLIGYTAPNQN